MFSVCVVCAFFCVCVHGGGQGLNWAVERKVKNIPVLFHKLEKSTSLMFTSFDIK
jgi:hypothetical protein